MATPFGGRTVAPLVMGSALNPVDGSVIATALVPIATALHVPVGRTSILVSSLYLACAIAQPTAGKLAEEFGPRRVFLAGIVVVLLGGLVGGLGNSLAVLVVARVLISIGTSCGYPSAMVIIRRRSHQAGLTEPPGSVLGSLAIAGSATVADRAADRRPPGSAAWGGARHSCGVAPQPRPRAARSLRVLQCSWPRSPRCSSPATAR